jgi:hypothetical protein
MASSCDQPRIREPLASLAWLQAEVTVTSVQQSRTEQAGTSPAHDVAGDMRALLRRDGAGCRSFLCLHLGPGLFHSPPRILGFGRSSASQQPSEDVRNHLVETA